MKRFCKDCGAFEPDEKPADPQEDAELGECRRRSPSPCIIGEESGALWPTVARYDYCLDSVEPDGIHRERCAKCDGMGQVGYVVCTSCDGHGHVWKKDQDFFRIPKEASP